MVIFAINTQNPHAMEALLCETEHYSHMGSLWVLYTAGFLWDWAYFPFCVRDEYFSIFFTVIIIGNMEICATRQ